MKINTLIIIAVTLIGIRASVMGSIIDDKSDFVGNFTVIDFETWADGTPIELEPDHATSILPHTYASLGVWVTAGTVPLIGYDASPHGSAAQEAMGSGTNAVTDVGRGGFLRFDFTVPVNAFGLAVMNRTDGEGVSFSVFGAADRLIESIDFSGALVDGSVPGADFGNPFDIEYGFVGVFTADQEISYVMVSQGIGMFDDLHFGVIPEPTTLLLITVGVIGMTCRRRVRLAHVRIVSGVAVLSVVLLSASASASIIDDKSDFVGDFTVIDFETWADGTPIALEPLEAISIPSFTYASLGVTITASDVPLIGRVSADQTLVALEAVGSPNNALGVFGRHGWVRFDFTVPVNAVALGVLNRSVGDPVALSFYDSADVLLESVNFNADVIDGTVRGADFGTAFDVDYGFVGAFVPNSQIAYAVGLDDFTGFDDLHFGVIPEPATVMLLALGVVIAGGFARSRRVLGRRPACALLVLVPIVVGTQTALAVNPIDGTVAGKVDLTQGPICGDNGWPGCPTHAGLTWVQLEGIHVCACVADVQGECQNECEFSTYTDANGIYQINEYEGSDRIRVTIDLDGEFARIGEYIWTGFEWKFELSDVAYVQYRDAPPYASIGFWVNTDNPFPEKETAHLTAFYHANQAHNFFRDRQPSDLPDFTEIDTPVMVESANGLTPECGLDHGFYEDVLFLGLSPSAVRLGK